MAYIKTSANYNTQFNIQLQQQILPKQNYYETDNFYFYCSDCYMFLWMYELGEFTERFKETE